MSTQCVSGLTFTAREYKIEDQRLLFNKPILRKGLLLQKMLETVTTRMDDAGPYPFEGETVPWSKVAVVDHMHALLLLQIEEDPKLELKPACRFCNEPIHPAGISADLSEVEIQPMQQIALEFLRTGEPMKFLWHKTAKRALCDAAGNPLSIEAEVHPRVPKSKVNYGKEACVVKGDPASIVELHMQVFLGKDQPLLMKLQRQDPDGILEHQTCIRIAAVKDPGYQEGAWLKHGGSIRNWFAEQGRVFRKTIERWIDFVEGGPEMSIDIDCVSCQRNQKVRIPFDPEFFGLIER